MQNAETASLISAAKTLPLDARAAIVDSLVDSLYLDGSSENDLKAVVERRLSDYRKGKTKLIPAEVVFAKANKLLKK